MILLDTALKERAKQNNPVKVGLVGAGYMGRGLVTQITNYHPGMEVVAISNRSVDKARAAYTQAGRDDIQEVSSVSALESCIEKRSPAVTDNASLLCEASGIEVIIEATG